MVVALFVVIIIIITIKMYWLKWCYH